MQFYELKLKVLQKPGENLTNPNLPSLNFIISKNPFNNVNHLTFDHSPQISS